AIVQFIESDAACHSGMNTIRPAIEQYRSACSRNAEIVSLSDSLEEWTVSSESKYTFWLQRPSDPYITEFHLSGLTREEALAIQKETDPGEPPAMPQRDDRGRVIGQQPNPNDPLYQRKASQLNKRQLLLYLQKCMSFKIPGETEEERSGWLGKRLIGDLVLLKEFIETNILSAEGAIGTF
ncbi:MAG: hypothetical protein DA330_09585, partial [Nitrososphaera sp.]|nr:hypothetical protein [Nitrososphaera sp.]